MLRTYLLSWRVVGSPASNAIPNRFESQYFSRLCNEGAVSSAGRVGKGAASVSASAVELWSTRLDDLTTYPRCFSPRIWFNSTRVLIVAPAFNLPVVHGAPAVGEFPGIRLASFLAWCSGCFVYKPIVHGAPAVGEFPGVRLASFQAWCSGCLFILFWRIFFSALRCHLPTLRFTAAVVVGSSGNRAHHVESLGAGGWGRCSGPFGHVIGPTMPKVCGKCSAAATQKALGR